MRLKKVRSPMPTARAASISSVVSSVKVVMPSTSDGFSPASASAALIASAVSWSSERPEFFENSVWPMPTIAASLLSVVGIGSALRPRQGDDHRARDVVAPGVPPGDLDLERVLALVLLLHGAAHLHGVAREVRRAELDRDPPEDGARSGPIRHVATDEAVRRQDVHEDVL